MKNIINKIQYLYCRRSSTTFVKYLKKNGCLVGKYTHFHDPKNTFIDPGRLKFIEIGDYCQITRNVTILAHDFSYSILKNVYNDMPQKSGITKIGNNVFIGMNTTILMGSKIGNNVIIGAGSVVSGSVPDNCVFAGNPAKKICSLDEYYRKCKDRYESNLYTICEYYYNKYKKYPEISELKFLSLLYLDDKLKKDNINLFKYPAIEDKEIKEYVFKTIPKYTSLEDFMIKNK